MRHHTTHKARKPWTCDDCGRTIHPGERYRHSSGPSGERHDCLNCAPEYATDFDESALCWYAPGACAV